MRLSILSVSQAAPYALRFLREFDYLATRLGAECVWIADGVDAYNTLMAQPRNPNTRVHEVTSRGFIESILDDAVARCTGEYILRLDDDELPSEAMVRWLANESYTQHDHWWFPRAHLWPDTQSMLLTPQLWPDGQTRLSIKEKSGGRHHIHAMSPFGPGECAGVMIHHHKFLVRSREEREETARRWHGGAMTAFSLPEEVYGTVRVVDPGNGHAEWEPEWSSEMQIGSHQ